MPSLSIITINYNDKCGLQKTLESVVPQTFRDYEHIIIDGGSSDGSKEVLDSKKPRFSHCISEPDNGIYHAMNKGIAYATGDYLLFLNSGDSLCNDNVLQQFFSTSPDTDLVYADINVVGKNDFYRKRYPDFLRFSYMASDSLPHPATLIKRTLFSSVGTFDEATKIVADWKFFMLALYKHNTSYKHLNFVACDFDYSGLSSNANNINAIKNERDVVLQQHFSLYLQDSIDSDHFKRLQKFIQRSLLLKFLFSLRLLKKLRKITND